MMDPIHSQVRHAESMENVSWTFLKRTEWWAIPLKHSSKSFFESTASTGYLRHFCHFFFSCTIRISMIACLSIANTVRIHHDCDIGDMNGLALSSLPFTRSCLSVGQPFRKQKDKQVSLEQGCWVVRGHLSTHISKVPERISISGNLFWRRLISLHLPRNAFMRMFGCSVAWLCVHNLLLQVLAKNWTLMQLYTHTYYSHTIVII